jgi:TfoX/Sxy family transcriptional regulator of competence genes
MATDQSYVDFICEQGGSAGALSYRKMFGEYVVYLDGKVVALVCDNTLFVKPTAEGRAMLGEVSEQPPYPGAKLHFRIGAEIDDAVFLQRLLSSTAQVLPDPKPKPKPKPKAEKSKKSSVKRPPA